MSKQRHGSAVLSMSFLSLGLSFSVVAEQSVVEVCADCHGQDGQARENTIPNLWGLSESYLTSQVKAFREQKRTSTFMQPIVHDLTDEQIKQAVAHYVAQPDAKTFTIKWRGETWPGDISLGEQIAYSGKWQDNVPACVSCHGPSGVGVDPSFPRLAGQNADYLKKQLMAWKQDKRPPGVLGSMVSISKTLSDEEIAAVSDYFANLGEQ
ncbi:c-type cytochrome [Vibrio hyugaensis]|uniref:c-type cytochrome n=1 Tax=Vibrio hyugaensis TaxID=1534743 RepID=UPI000694CE14|nr:cytochrome c [Vibrio hyugaensis]